MSGPSERQPSRAQWLRRLALRRRERVAFVFSGGGPLAALQVGAARALLERGIKPDLVVGTSAGALNATFTAFHPTVEGSHELERVWLGLTDQEMFPGGRFKASWARMVVRGNRVFENSGLRKLVSTNLPGARIEDAQIPLAIVATELETGNEKLFTNGPLLDPLLASAALPGVFPPITIDGVVYIDGGVANNVPIAPAVALGAKTLYVMDATSNSHQRRPLERPMDYLLHAFTLARSQRLGIDLAAFSDRVKVEMLPLRGLGHYIPFASMAYSKQLIESGYRDTVEYLDSRDRPEMAPPVLSGDTLPALPADPIG